MSGSPKRGFFQARGVSEYWIVDIDARVIERWRPGEARPEILDDRLEWRPAPHVAPLVVDLGNYLREVWAEG